MSQHELEPLLHDVLKAGQRITDYVGKKTEDEYVGDAVAHDVAERNFITIGEALMQAIKISPKLETQVPGAREAIAFRHVLTHGYRMIDHRRVWKIIHFNLPLLLTECRSLLGELPA
ncbi:MAG TPA: HepT-like ribonuclease domain-containing protein [Thermoanaerobaculia bacterium]